MKRRVIFFSFCIFLSCSTPAIAQHGTHFTYTYSKVNHGNFEDELDDVSQAFLDFGPLSIQLTEDSIRVKMGLKDIPDLLTFNHKTLEIKKLNYEWSLTFDVDNSNSISKGDILLSVANFKLQDEVIISDVLSATQQNLWVYKEGKEGASNKGDITDIHISGNSIILSVAKKLNSNLEKIDSNTNFHFQALFNDGKKKYRDTYPN